MLHTTYTLFLQVYSFLPLPEDMLIDFREGESDGEREGKKHQCEREHCTLNGVQTCNLGMWHEQESKP